MTTAQHECRLNPAEVHRQLTRFVARVRAALKRWRKAAGGKLEIDDIWCSYCKTYRRSRRAFRVARKRRDAAASHEWRKNVKAHGYQNRLLRCAWPPLMKKPHRQLARLGSLLGEDHDLTMLRSRLEASRNTNADADPLDAAFHTMRERCDSLRAEALLLGARLFSERPAAVELRMRRWWKVARM